MNLRDHLLNSLSSLPGPHRRFHIHVLTSVPRKHSTLFPYATPTKKPRVYVQDFLVLCSEQNLTISSTPVTSTTAAATTTTKPDNDTNTTTSSNPLNSSNTSASTSNSASKDDHVFVTAIFASLFHIPSNHSAILYISKVDSTGQGARPSPTGTLVRAFLTFFAKPSLRPERLRGHTSGYGARSRSRSVTNIGVGTGFGSGPKTLFNSKSGTGIDVQPHSNAHVHPSLESSVNQLVNNDSNNDNKINENGTTLWIHLFARAERQYLFPNSADHESKKPLKDVQLCAWWKRVITQAVHDMIADRKEGEGDAEEEDREQARRAKLFYVLPGLEELEAVQKLGISPTSNDQILEPKWVYGHPYSQTGIPLPYKIDSGTSSLGGGGGDTAAVEEEKNLGQLIPWFDDDPKSRFIDEIAYTTQVDGMGTYSPKRKRRKTATERISRISDENSEIKEEIEGSGQMGNKEKEKDSKKAHVLGELGIVSADEFWERMSFRQECVSGALTGFFVAAFPAITSSGQMSSRSKEPAGSDMNVEQHQNAKSSTKTSTNREVDLDFNPLKPAPGEVSHRLVQRVLDSLMKGCEFSTSEKSVRATRILEQAIRGLCSGSANTSDGRNGENKGDAVANGDHQDSSATERKNVDSREKPEFLGVEWADDQEMNSEKDRGDIVRDGDGVEGLLAPPLPKTPPRGTKRLAVEDVSPNPFPDPEATTDMYTSFVYGSIEVDNPLPVVSDISNKTEQVHVLNVRKKKRK